MSTRTPSPLEAEVVPELPRDVVDFCSGSRHGLLPLVVQAIRLARRAFAPVRDLTAEMDIDGDTDERRVVIDVTADLPVDEMLERYRRYTSQWLDAAPAAAREWVRLSYHAGG